MKVILVSGSDARQFPLLQGLVRSIREAPESGGIALGIFDAGFEPDQRAWIDERADVVVEPEWDLRDGAGLPGYLRLFDSRMLLPRYFPGYEVYLWLDADTWVQDWSAVDLYLRAAEMGALGVVAEVNPAFRNLTPALGIQYRWYRPARIRSWAHRRYRRAYGRRTMRELALKPVLNSGAFSLAREAPHWEAWRNSTQQALARESTIWVNQVALNHAVYRHALPVQLLPSRCNWTCSSRLPVLDERTGLLVEPYLPNEPIGIIHMTWITKSGDHELATLAGGRVTRSLGYRGRSEAPRLEPKTRS